MTNEKIIFDAAVASGIFTEAEAMGYIVSGRRLPLHTYSEWRRMGYQVKQGEPLLMIHYNDETNLDAAIDYLRNAYRLAPRRPTPPTIVVERVA